MIFFISLKMQNKKNVKRYHHISVLICIPFADKRTYIIYRETEVCCVQWCDNFIKNLSQMVKIDILLPLR